MTDSASSVSESRSMLSSKSSLPSLPSRTPSPSVSPVAGALLVAAAAALWGTVGTAQTFIVGGLAPAWVGALRLIFASVFFRLLLLVAGRRSREDAAQAASTERFPFGLALFAGLAMGFYNLAFFAGVKAAGIAVGTAAVIGSAPVWAGLLETIVFKKRPPLLWCAGTVVAVASGTLLALSGTSGAELDLAALGLCLLAGFMYASYTLLSKSLVRRTTPLRATSATFLFAMLVALPAAFLISGMPDILPADLRVVAYLGLVTTGGAYLLFTTGLKGIRASTGVALSLVEPVTAFLLAVTVAGEAVTFTGVLALAGILAGLAIVLKADA